MSLENPFPEDNRQFFSNDPYEVLGVSRFANNEEINNARKNLQKRFHPDVSKNPRAAEIAQNINIALDILNGKGGDLGGNSSQPTSPFGSEKPKSKPTSPAEKVDPIIAERKNYYDGRYLNGKRIETLEDEILWELREGFLQFRSYLERRSEKWEIKKEQIKQVIESEKGQQIKKEMFMSQFWNYLSKLSDRGGESYLETLADWAKLDVDISNFINLPEVVKELESTAKIKMDGYRPQDFKPYVQSWMKAGWQPSQEIMDAFNK